MTNHERLLDLLDEWDARRESGSAISAHELCKDCPELADQLVQYVAADRAMAWVEQGAPPSAVIQVQHHPEISSPGRRMPSGAFVEDCERITRCRPVRFLGC